MKGAQTVVSRVKAIPSELKSWNTSSTRAGADIALSLTHIHCEGVDEEKLKNLWVVNNKSANFEDFIEMFMAAAT